ncbi:hypothetical protein X801_07619, partial [Opisthorchis viverrini]
MEKFCSEVPKIELHAHLSGSISQTTLLNILGVDQSESLMKRVALKQGDQRTLDE